MRTSKYVFGAIFLLVGLTLTMNGGWFLLNKESCISNPVCLAYPVEGPALAIWQVAGGVSLISFAAAWLRAIKTDKKAAVWVYMGMASIVVGCLPHFVIIMDGYGLAPSDEAFILSCVPLGWFSILVGIVFLCVPLFKSKDY